MIRNWCGSSALRSRKSRTLRHVQAPAIKLAWFALPAYPIALQISEMGIPGPALRSLELHIAGLDDDAAHPGPLAGRGIEFPTRIALQGPHHFGAATSGIVTAGARFLAGTRTETFWIAARLADRVHHLSI